MTDFTKFTSNLKKKLNQLESEGLVVLQKTSLIQDLEGDAHNLLTALYSNMEEATTVNKAIMTIVNSIITQECPVFILDRKNLKEMLKTDPNYSKPTCLRNDDYKKLIRSLAQSGIAKRLYEGVGRQGSVFEVCPDEILEILETKLTDELRDSTIEFAKKPTDFKTKTTPVEDGVIVEETPEEEVVVAEEAPKKARTIIVSDISVVLDAGFTSFPPYEEFMKKNNPDMTFIDKTATTDADGYFYGE